MIPEIHITIPTDNIIPIDLGGFEKTIGDLLGDVHLYLKVNNYKYAE